MSKENRPQILTEGLRTALGVALVLVVLLLGTSLVLNSCSNIIAACTGNGGSWDGNDGSCELPDR